MSKPVSVIRKVEDSPVWLDRRLVNAYLRTNYRVTVAPFFEIRIGVANPVFEHWLNEQNFKSFTFITAWNPYSESLSFQDNRLRNNDLEKGLRKITGDVLPGFGVGDDDAWPPEESFVAFDLTADDAINLGRRYNQNAIVWWERGGLPELWWL